MSKVDVITEKGKDQNNEMFSAFRDAFGNKSKAASIDLAALLKTHDVSRVDVVGLAGDFCVKYTALDARKEGFEVIVFKDAIRNVDAGTKGWEATAKEFEDAGVKTLNYEDQEENKIGVKESEDWEFVSALTRTPVQEIWLINVQASIIPNQ